MAQPAVSLMVHGKLLADNDFYNYYMILMRAALTVARFLL